MRILLISPYSDIASIGLRILSACVLRSGHHVNMVFLPHSAADETSRSDPEQTYPDRVLDSLTELARQSDLAGITLMTNYLHRARTLSQTIRRNPHIAIVWGGIHPTIRPQDGAGYADFSIIGEGEDAFVDLISRLEKHEDCSDIPNLWFQRDGRTLSNPPRPLIQNLDMLPFPDYGPENHYIWDHDTNELVPMTLELLRKYIGLGPISGIRGEVTYQTLATRGCPHRCSYCCNDYLQKLYHGQKHLRRRSDDHVLAELKQVRDRYPFIQGIGFSDDSFFAAPDEKIIAFAERYRREIGLPFFCLGSPLTITEPKLTALLDAGLYGLQMGVQTGSQRIQGIYNRRISNEKVLKTVELLHRYSHRMVPPSYDFIIDSPWENPEDLLETLRLIRRFPRPYRLQLFSLVIFPETGLDERAKQEGILSGDDESRYAREYHERKASYVNLVLGAYRYPIWKPILDLLSHPVLVRLLNRPVFNRLYGLLYRFGKSLNRTFLKNR